MSFKVRLPAEGFLAMGGTGGGSGFRSGHSEERVTLEESSLSGNGTRAYFSRASRALGH